MEITLEQIELVKDRTGASYKDAKEALELSNGNVVDAIIYIEENINNDYKKKESSSVHNIMNYIKEMVRTGNVTRIRVLKGEDTILSIPVTVGAVATLVFPWAMLAAAIASAASKCKVELLKEDGTVVDVNEKAGKVVGSVKDKSGVVIDEIKDKSGDIYEAAKTKGADIWNSVMDKGGDILESAKAAGSVIIEEAKEKGAKVYENTKDRVNEYFSGNKEEDVIDISDIDFEEESDVDGSINSGSDDGIDK